jgi:hypothetical protein
VSSRFVFGLAGFELKGGVGRKGIPPV